MKPFQYPVKRRVKKIDATYSQPATEPQTVEKIGEINGVTPGSVEEWRVAVALWHFKKRFEYQIPLFGGRSVRGGQVLDFLVLDPFPMPLQVFGEYWHEGEMNSEERLNISRIENYFKQKMIILWGSQLENQTMAINSVGRVLG
jgi:hypothetical protein